MGDLWPNQSVFEEELRLAIDGGGLVVHYQPILASDDGRPVSVEALVRWQHATHGLIAPGQFIGRAEECGLIIAFGEWVLRRACIDARRWPNLRIAVNVSPMQFLHEGFVASVARIVRETGFEPERLELELTEGILIADAKRAQEAITTLRALGIRMALDDFGTGYSSLSYLHRFVFDKIKIDRSFLEPNTQEGATILRAMIGLGRALGMTVTAEGIESAEQQRFLQALGAHELQGFLFSPAVPAADIDVMITQAASGRGSWRRKQDPLHSVA